MDKDEPVPEGSNFEDQRGGSGGKGGKDSGRGEPGKNPEGAPGDRKEATVTKAIYRLGQALHAATQDELASANAKADRPIHENLTIAVAEMWRTYRLGQKFTDVGKQALMAARAQGMSATELLDLMQLTKEKARRFPKRT